MRNSCRKAGPIVTASVALALLAVATARAGDPPIITVHPLSQAVCAGESVTLNVTAIGAETYEWFKDGESIAIQTAPALQLELVTGDDAGEYHVVVRNSYGSDTSDPATLTVYTGVVIDEQPLGQSACEGDSVSLAVVASGYELSYQWFELVDGDLVQIPGATGATLALSPVSPAHAGDYQVAVIDGCDGSIRLSDVATLTVTELPWILESPAGQTVCAGEPVTFTVVAGGDDLSYQWYKDDAPLAGQTSDMLTLSAPTPDDSGDYHAVVSNSCGDAASASATLLVDPGPAIIAQPQSQEACAGDEITLSVTLDNPGTIFVDTVGATGSSSSGLYLRGNYYRVDTPRTLTRIEQYLTITTSSTLVFFIYESADQYGTYALILEDALSTSGTGRRYFSSNPLSVQLQAGRYYLIGAGAPVAHTFHWGSTHGATTFGASFKGFSSPWPGSGVLPDPAPATFLSWAYAQRLTTSDIALTYQWRKDDTDLPGAAGPEYTIQSMSASDVGDYNVMISSDCGDATSDTASITLSQAATIWQQPQSQTACVDDQVSFSVGATGSDLSYQWRKNGVEIDGATASVYSIARVRVSDAGVYDVVISNPCEVVSSSATLGVSEAPPTITAHPAGLAACTGDRVTFEVVADGAYLQYQWYRDDVAIPGATGASYTVDGVTLDAAGDYHVEVSNVCGAVTSDSATLAVNETVAIDQQPQGGELCVGAPHSFRVVATGTDLLYQWYLGADPIPDAVGDTHTLDAVALEDAGDYLVVVSNDCGEVASDTATLAVMAGPVISAQPIDQTVRVGQPLSLSVTIDLASFPDDVDAVGDPLSSNLGANRIRGNVHAVGDEPVTLTRIEQYLNVTTSGPLVFFVYESDDGTSDPYELVLEDRVAASGTGLGFFASHPLEVGLDAHKHYLIGAAWQNTHAYYWEPDAHPKFTTFGQTTRGYATSYTGSLPYHPAPSSPHVWCQRLTTVRPVAAYQWRKDEVEIPGATDPTFFIPAVGVADGGHYDVAATNGCGTTVSDEARVIVTSLRPTAEVSQGVEDVEPPPHP